MESIEEMEKKRRRDIDKQRECSVASNIMSVMNDTAAPATNVPSL